MWYIFALCPLAYKTLVNTYSAVRMRTCFDIASKNALIKIKKLRREHYIITL